jgi:carbonic anhydrase
MKRFIFHILVSYVMITGLLENYLLAAQKANTIASKNVLEKLLKGNERFRQGTPMHTINSAHDRKKLVDAQFPIACIVCCSDSRVPPEIIFDQRLGRLFVVRSAGNVIDALGFASLEYAVRTLGVKSIIVLGHENCGAVQAALSDKDFPGHIPQLIKKIKPAVYEAQKMQGNKLENAIMSNIRLMIKKLKTNQPVLAEEYKKHNLSIHGGYFRLQSGKVEILDNN